MAAFTKGVLRNPFQSDVVVTATFKVLVLGNTDVGKTSLIRHYTSSTEGDMSKSLLPTVGIDFTDVIISVRGTKVKLRVWDTAGQERFFTFTKQFFRGTQGVLLVYDITSIESFQTLKKWLQTIRDMGLERISVVVIGNKQDLLDERQVPKQLGEKLASRHGHQYIEASAHNGTNVEKAFCKLAEALIYSHGIFQPGVEAQAMMNSYSYTSDSSARRDSSIVLEEYTSTHDEKSAKCCKS